MIKIDKNIPMPRSMAGRIYHPYQDKITELLKMLEVGDSFFDDGNANELHGNLGKYSMKSGSWIFGTAKKLNMKIGVRLVEENGIQGARIWRVK